MKKFIAILFFIIFSFAIHADDDHILEIKEFSSLESENVEFLPIGTTLTLGAVKGYVVSQPLLLDMNFNALTITWQGRLTNQVRILFCVSPDGYEWSKWYFVPRQEFDYVWKEGNYRYIQYRAFLYAVEEHKRPLLHKIVLHYDFIPTKSLEIVDVNTRDVYAYIAKPSIVSRSTWGARPPKSSYTSHTPNKITIHHTWRPTASDYIGNTTIRQIQNYHMDTNGWADIGYHFLIGTYPSNGSTSIFQGRPEDKVGAHTGGYNTNNIGVNVIGDYTTESLHPNSYSKLIELLAWICYQYRISPGSIYGHCDFGSTACPGTILYSKISQIRNDVAKKLQSN